jgi:hypothetical protein
MLNYLQLSIGCFVLQEGMNILPKCNEVNYCAFRFSVFHYSYLGYTSCENILEKRCGVLQWLVTTRTWQHNSSGFADS